MTVKDASRTAGATVRRFAYVRTDDRRNALGTKTRDGVTLLYWRWL